MACTVAMQHALSEGLLVAMEEWAAKQPAALPDALEAVERISELLDLSGLFSALLLHPRRDRKRLSYTGGIRVSGLDFGYPCPYGALESYQRSRRRSLGADVRLAGSRALAWAPQRRHQGRFPEPDPGRGCAGAGLRREALQRAADALPARRAAARCRAHSGGAAAVGQPAPAESDAGGRWLQRQLQVLPKVRRRSLRAVAVCHVGRLIGRRRSACLLGKKIYKKPLPA